MKKLTTLAALVALATGCAYHTTTENTFNPETGGRDVTQFKGIVWFNKQAIKGLTVGKRTATGSTTLSVSEATTETQADVIRAATEGATAGAVRGMKP